MLSFHFSPHKNKIMLANETRPSWFYSLSFNLITSDIICVTKMEVLQMRWNSSQGEFIPDTQKLLQ